MTNLQQANKRGRFTWQITARAGQRGDRLYATIRLALVIIFGVVVSTSIGNLSLQNPQIVIMIGYAVVSLGLLGFAFVGRPRWHATAGFCCDVIFLSLIAFLFPIIAEQLLPFYGVPLLAAGLRDNGRDRALIGGMAGAGYLLSQFAGVLQVPSLNLDALSLATRFCGLVLLPEFAFRFARYWAHEASLRADDAEQSAQTATEQSERTAREMYRLFHAINALNLGKVNSRPETIETLLDRVQDLLPHRAAFLLSASSHPEQLLIAAQRGLHQDDRQRRFHTRHGAIAKSLATPEPWILIADDENKAEPLRQLIALSGCPMIYLVPMQLNGRPYGILVVGMSTVREHARVEAEALAALAGAAIFTIHNAQLSADLKVERSRLLEQEDRLRRQVARDLHDGPAQAIASLTMSLAIIRRYLDRDLPKAIEELERIIRISKRTSYDVRTMLFELRPVVLDTSGIHATAEQYIERLRHSDDLQQGPQITLTSDGIDGVRLEKAAEAAIFNILQESINNARKHANAKLIAVRLLREDDLLTMTIKDDGKGFDLQQVYSGYEKRGSLGLVNIEERARMVGGTASISSSPGKGTFVTVVVPIANG